jgi:branched-chain amino acid transport system ATP-binding protein
MSDAHDGGLVVEALSVAYRGTAGALDGVSVAVPARARIAVLGANGAGKTTLVRAITGMLAFHSARVSSGRIAIGDEDITGARSGRTVRLGLTQVPEGRQMFSRLTVEENLLLGALTRSGRRELAGDVDRALEFFPALSSKRRVKAGLLSGGEQQMVALARAIMAKPRVFVIDELTLGLSPRIIEDLVVLLEEVLDATGASLLLVEQNARLALELCRYGYVLDRGHVTHEGSSAALTTDQTIQDSYLGVRREAVAMRAPEAGT